VVIADRVVFPVTIRSRYPYTVSESLDRMERFASLVRA
jgi:hypothetical protein